MDIQSQSQSQHQPQPNGNGRSSKPKPIVAAPLPAPGYCQSPYTRFDDDRCPVIPPLTPITRYCETVAAWGVKGYGYLCHRHFEMIFEAHPDIPVEDIHRLSDDDNRFIAGNIVGKAGSEESSVTITVEDIIDRQIENQIDDESDEDI